MLCFLFFIRNKYATTLFRYTGNLPLSHSIFVWQWNFWMTLDHPSSDTRLFTAIKVNTMPNDALASFVARSSVVMILTMLDKGYLFPTCRISSNWTMPVLTKDSKEIFLRFRKSIQKEKGQQIDFMLIYYTSKWTLIAKTNNRNSPFRSWLAITRKMAVWKHISDKACNMSSRF